MGAPPETSDFDKAFLPAGAQATASGVQYADVTPGTGAVLGMGQVAKVTFTGWLGNGKEFDSSAQRPGDMCLLLGDPRGMTFFNEGLVGMKEGGTRRLRVLPEQGYGQQGRPPVIPPNSTLLFEIKLLQARPGATRPDTSSMKLATTPTGLKWADVTVGKGPEVKAGTTAIVSYSGFLEDGTKVDSSADRCQTMPVANVGQGPVMAGWNEGLVGMRQGGRRVLVVPGPLAYGAEGRPPIIPPDATLVFELEVTDVITFPDVSKLDLTTTATGLKWADVKPGKGAEVTQGATVLVGYSGWLPDGTKFDSGHDKGRPYPVVNVGQAQVVAGWNQGLVGMKEGGRRVLVIPPELAYGADGRPPVIPANSTLVFLVDAVKVMP